MNLSTSSSGLFSYSTSAWQHECQSVSSRWKYFDKLSRDEVIVVNDSWCIYHNNCPIIFVTFHTRVLEMREQRPGCGVLCCFAFLLDYLFPLMHSCERSCFLQFFLSTTDGVMPKIFKGFWTEITHQIVPCSMHHAQLCSLILSWNYYKYVC